MAILLANGSMHLCDRQTYTTRWVSADGWHMAAGRFAVYSPCGKFLVTTDPDDSRSLAVWDVARREIIRLLRGHDRVVLGASMAEDGTLRSWGADGTIRTWDLLAGKEIRVLALEPPIRPTG
jgi:WD40 repeat protein